MFVAAGTPPDIVLNIQQTLAKALADPKVREVWPRPGRLRSATRPPSFDAQYKADIARYARVIEQAKIQRLD